MVEKTLSKPDDYEAMVERLASLDPTNKPFAERMAVHMAREILSLRRKGQEVAMERLVELTESYGGYDPLSEQE